MQQTNRSPNKADLHSLLQTLLSRAAQAPHRGSLPLFIAGRRCGTLFPGAVAAIANITGVELAANRVDFGRNHPSGEALNALLAEIAQALRQAGLKIGSTTGYPRAVMTTLMPLAAAKGYAPDCVVCADDLAAGARPGPWMALDCVQQLKINAVGRCVKVDDTAPGIEEGVNAGMWTVGLALSGSPAGLTLEEYRTATPETLQRVRERVSTELRAAGAHYIIDSVADLPALLTQIQARMSRGETPSAA
jgi:HAD superfamily hydrolase (TIGR01509 family)